MNDYELSYYLTNGYVPTDKGYYYHTNQKEIEPIDVFMKVKEVIEKNLTDDIGIFLSGGVDSSIITEIARRRTRPYTFTLLWDDIKEEDWRSALLIADFYHTRHRGVSFDVKACILNLPKIVSYLDNPLGDPAIIPTYFMAKVASKYVKVVLTGEGGDECFGGYDEYWHIIQGYKHKTIFKFLGNFIFPSLVPSFRNFRKYFEFAKEFLPALDNPTEAYHISTRIFSDEEKEKLVGRKLPKIRAEITNDLYNSMNRYNIINGVPPLLQKTYNMTEPFGLEARMPFLEPEMIEFALTIPSSQKLKGRTTKYILREAFKGLVPDKIITRKKRGFNVPIENWLGNEMKDFTLKILEESKIFNQNYIRQLMDNIKGLKNARKIWLLLIYELWHKQHGGN